MIGTFLESFGKQTSIGQSRTAATNPMQWTLAIALLGIVTLVAIHAPSWLIILLAGCFVTMLFVLAYVFLYLIHKDRDALRSERYVLDKIALQSRLFGDSDSGLQQVIDYSSTPKPIESRTLDGPLLNSPDEKGRSQ